MEKETLNLLNRVNRAIIKFRGIYSVWSNERGISYHEMLVLYTIRENGFCTQKQICGNYLLPKQTIHNVIASLRKDGILIYDEKDSKGREKAFVLSEKGKEYAAPFLESLDTVESRALELLGEGKLQVLTELLLEYDRALKLALEESR
ncbi:MAG: winged helix-turn-helix transcriptional regulator [Lachnospiraceae bacterium]|nr:winged helix-turn-helix transcriptional regulator [Lachnospiraceae bacterium]